MKWSDGEPLTSEDIRFYSADVLGTAEASIALKDEFSIFTTRTRPSFTETSNPAI
jgi:hypothetical protein